MRIYCTFVNYNVFYSNDFMRNIIFFFISLFLFAGCDGVKENHFLTDKNYRDQVHEQFLKRKGMAASREKVLFGVLENDSLSLEQREALEFLYAYMPLCDLADYDGHFFLDQVDASFRARDYFPWGKTVPEDVFRHFVLVHRINNENLDISRMVFFEELKDRIKGMSMEEAVLEVNHWCHEKVTYKGTDARTSAPLALVRTSWGRCGEESTFTATALRAVGIPARQCYTPRWAHTDDNHAWVEVWVDGKWHYIGACEPEAELDVAWFTAPAKRAMMVHTNVFGLYNGPEEKNLEKPLYSKINLTSNYAEVRKLKVKVLDESGKSVEGADVRFKLYNYAQIYPIAETTTDKEGQASLLTGLGDLVVWASVGEKFGYEKAVSTNNLVEITLNKRMGDTYNENMELVPPVEQKIKEIAADKQAENARRFVYEDSVRNAYMASFMSQEQSDVLAKELNLAKDLVWKYIQSAQGNWKEISCFIRQESQNPYLFPFLASLSEKDLRDTPSQYLRDFLNKRTVTGLNETIAKDKDFAARYVLSPRIGLELIRPWNSYLNAQFADGNTKSLTALGVMNWIKNNISLNEDENYYNCAITPIGVYELKVSDRYSRDLFFVALCRKEGIPARLEPATGKPQYYENGVWTDAVFEAEKPALVEKTSVTFTNNPSNLVKSQYEVHYTLAKFEGGDFVPLDYWDDPALKKYPATLSVDTGYYRLMIGSRANDGSVTTSTSYFNLKTNQRKTLDLKLPEVQGKIRIMGIVDMNTIVQLTDRTKKSLKELSNGKGLMLCFVDPDKEPSKHVLQDLPALQAEFENWGGGIVLMTPEDKLSVAFDPSTFKRLPKQTIWTVDLNRTLLKTVSTTLQLNFQNNFPLTLLLSNNGGILYFSEGYRIGIGENIMKTIQMQNQQ